MSTYISRFSGTQVDEAVEATLTAITEGNGLATQADLATASDSTLEEANAVIQAVSTRVTKIESEIPNTASANNQLADKDFVNSSINNMAAFYITSNAEGDAFATKADLLNATTFYSGGEERVPTQNDYAIVLADESKATEGVGGNPTTRYSYQGGTYPDGQWDFQYIVNNTPLTQAQIDALNSKITESLVEKLVRIPFGNLTTTIPSVESWGTTIYTWYTLQLNQSVKFSAKITAKEANEYNGIYGQFYEGAVNSIGTYFLFRMDCPCYVENNQWSYWNTTKTGWTLTNWDETKFKASENGTVNIEINFTAGKFTYTLQYEGEDGYSFTAVFTGNLATTTSVLNFHLFGDGCTISNPVFTGATTFSFAAPSYIESEYTFPNQSGTFALTEDLRKATYLATSTQNGLMSAADKAKLDAMGSSTAAYIWTSTTATSGGTAGASGGSGGWTTAASGSPGTYQITIAAATHGKGNYPTVQLFLASNGDSVSTTVRNTGNGNLIIFSNTAIALKIVVS